MLNLIIWLIAGAIIGWLASRVMETNGRQGTLFDIVAGAVGALIAGWFLTPVLGISTINQGDFSLSALLVSFVGAILLLAVVRLFQQVIVNR